MIVFIVNEKGYSAEKQILKYPKIILKKRKISSSIQNS